MEFFQSQAQPINLEQILYEVKTELGDLESLVPAAITQKIQALLGTGLQPEIIETIRLCIQHYHLERQIIQYIRIVDKLLKIPFFNQILQNFLVQFYSETFIFLFQQRSFSELDQLKILRKLWLKSVHPRILIEIREVLLFNLNIDVNQGFKTQDIAMIKRIYEEKLGLSADQLQRHLPKSIKKSNAIYEPQMNLQFLPIVERPNDMINFGGNQVHQNLYPQQMNLKNQNQMMFPPIQQHYNIAHHHNHYQNNGSRHNILPHDRPQLMYHQPRRQQNHNRGAYLNEFSVPLMPRNHINSERNTDEKMMHPHPQQYPPTMIHNKQFRSSQVQLRMGYEVNRNSESPQRLPPYHQFDPRNEQQKRYFPSEKTENTHFYQHSIIPFSEENSHRNHHHRTQSVERSEIDFLEREKEKERQRYHSQERIHPGKRAPQFYQGYPAQNVLPTKKIHLNEFNDQVAKLKHPNAPKQTPKQNKGPLRPAQILNFLRNDLLYRCKQCGNSFKKWESYDEHVTRHFHQKMLPTVKRKQPFINFEDWTHSRSQSSIQFDQFYIRLSNIRHEQALQSRCPLCNQGFELLFKNDTWVLNKATICMLDGKTIPMHKACQQQLDDSSTP